MIIKKLLKIGITGASGRMGRTLIKLACSDSDVELRLALEFSESKFLGNDAGENFGTKTGTIITSNIEGIKNCDVIIDFTRPSGSLKYLQECVSHNVPAVIGTTGFTAQEMKSIKSSAEKIPVVYAPNMSIGVNVLLRLVELAAKTLGPKFDAEILEAHHREKEDAPSGTALKIGEVVAKSLGKDLRSDGVFSRYGFGEKRKNGSIGFATIRGGDVVGDHTAIFAGDGERIEISHKASDRSTFARGAMRAAKYVTSMPPGLYDMNSVLGS